MDTLKKKAFVLMPFQEPLNSYYPAVFKPALEEAGFEVARADDLFNPRPIILDIQKSIVDAHLILCDMSGKNPNVFYELGLAHAIGKPVILVSRKEDDIPFDLRHVRIILYDYTIAKWEEKLRNAIAAAAKSVENDEEVWPPSILPKTQASSSPRSISETAIFLLKKVDAFYEDVQKIPNHEIILSLSRESFLKQSDEIAKRFMEFYELLALPKDILKEMTKLIDLDDVLFVEYKIPFGDVDNLKALWFVTDGLKAERHIKIRDYQPRWIPSGSQTNSDGWCNALYNKALIESPDSLFYEYVAELIDIWKENYNKYQEFIHFWNSIEFNNKYMNIDQFLAQRSDIARKFEELYDEIRTYFDLKDYGFREPYEVKDWIKELKITLKRMSRMA